MGNNRGTDYSQKHVEYSIDQREFWEWSWAEMGMYDDPAFIRKIKEVSGAEKIYYVGYSQGSIQMFYGLSRLEEEFYADSLYKFIAMAPCTLAATIGPESDYEESLYRAPDIGVYSLYGGPNWESNYNKLCTELHFHVYS